MKSLAYGVACMALPLSLATAQSTLVVPGGTYPTIQSALTAAVNGDTVLVLPGTYVESIDVLGKDILITSASSAADTIIDGGGLGRTVLFSAGSTRACVFEGFTVTGGFTTGGIPAVGGGIRVEDAEPTIRDCVITGNTADSYGGGIGVAGTAGPLIERCTVSGNQAAGLGYASGGGIAAVNATPGTFGTEIRHCIISDNEAATRGGGIHMQYSPGCTVDSCQVTRNTTLSTSTSLAGGAGMFYALNSAAVVSNCRIWENVSNGNGGGVKWFNVTALAFVNNTIVDNVGGGAAGYANTGAFGNNVIADFANCIIWQNGAANEFEFSGTDAGGLPPDANVDYCVVTGGYPTGSGNLSTAPELLNSLSGNHRLATTSPCIDAGNAAALPLPSVDFEGDNRVIGGAVDIGADEFNPASPMHYSDVATLSSGAPGPIQYFVTNGPANGLFAVVFSLSGTEPGVTAFGQQVPLNPDGLTLAYLLVGVTDGAGDGTATMPPLTVPSVLIGRTLSSVALTYLTAFDFTNAENVRLIP